MATTRNTVPKNRVTKKERERDMSLQGEVRSSKLHRRIELCVWPIFNCVSNLEQRERRNRVHFELESVIEKELDWIKSEEKAASSKVQLSGDIGSGDQVRRGLN